MNEKLMQLMMQRAMAERGGQPGAPPMGMPQKPEMGMSGGMPAGASPAVMDFLASMKGREGGMAGAPTGAGPGQGGGMPGAPGMGEALAMFNKQRMGQAAPFGAGTGPMKPPMGDRMGFGAPPMMKPAPDMMGANAAMRSAQMGMRQAMGAPGNPPMMGGGNRDQIPAHKTRPDLRAMGVMNKVKGPW